MAVAQKVDSGLQLVFEDGVNPETGETILRRKSFNNVKTTATADQLFAIASALVPLQQKTLNSIQQKDDLLITES
ncbi:DUF1659 domain-containing protein [Radiobacillus kanasensis]|uniref:DUF1659 domain-containing protein n=1 Tax=Radiobacillus kanasensis TaxID=2844358 RepID=UPI001E476DD9|nr:DUF1659 domain-containing protein [Radiobacillus kanasensis]UFT98874.1 DUF1659 domain-containing protein [Radiobacillus kanasensis]